jgi:hypothetical protein
MFTPRPALITTGCGPVGVVGSFDQPALTPARRRVVNLVSGVPSHEALGHAAHRMNNQG